MKKLKKKKKKSLTLEKFIKSREVMLGNIKFFSW